MYFLVLVVFLRLINLIIYVNEKKNKEKIWRHQPHSDLELNINMHIYPDMLQKQRKSLRRTDSSGLLNELTQQMHYV